VPEVSTRRKVVQHPTKSDGAPDENRRTKEYEEDEERNTEQEEDGARRTTRTGIAREGARDDENFDDFRLDEETERRRQLDALTKVMREHPETAAVTP
jgi:hypothetical protein